MAAAGDLRGGGSDAEHPLAVGRIVANCVLATPHPNFDERSDRPEPIRPGAADSVNSCQYYFVVRTTGVSFSQPDMLELA